MLVYVLCYGAGMLFASSAHYYLSGASLLLAAVWLYWRDVKKYGSLLDLQALFSLFFIGGQGISCLKLSKLQTDWSLKTWLCFFCAAAVFRLVYGRARSFFQSREPSKKGKRKWAGDKRSRIFTAILILTAISLMAFLLEAAVLGYVPFFVRGVPHAYSYFHISGVHYFTVSCVLVPSMAVLWLFSDFRQGWEDAREQEILEDREPEKSRRFYRLAAAGSRKETAAVLAAVLTAVLIPVLCVSRFQLIFGVILAVLTFMTVTGNQRIRYLIAAAAALIPLYIVLTIARSHDVAYLNGIFEMKNPQTPIFVTQPYMYIANNYDNFNCLVEELPRHSLGLKGMFPLWAFTGLKFLKPELVNWPLYTTKEELTTVTLFYDAYYDFGVAGVILFAAALGAAAGALSVWYRRGTNPAWPLFYAQAALYFMLSFFTTWYSNPTTWFYFGVTAAFALWCGRNGWPFQKDRGTEKQ